MVIIIIIIITIRLAECRQPLQLPHIQSELRAQL